MDELGKQVGLDAIEALSNESHISWLVDTNVILYGDAERLLGKNLRIRTTPGVVSEVRKRDDNKRANEFVDVLIRNDAILTSESFGQAPQESFEFLLGCSMHLSPAVRVIEKKTERDGQQATTESSARAVERAALDGRLFTCELDKRLAQDGVFTEEELRLDKAKRKPWYRYPTKRRQREQEGTCIYTDETLVATAIAHALLLEKPTCLLSNDGDLQTIMKQCTDNILWAVSMMDCEISHGTAVLGQVSELWSDRCADLDRFRSARNVERMQKAATYNNYSELPLAELYGPATDELVLCSLVNRFISGFAYSSKMIEFVREYPFLQKRSSLIARGVQFP